MLKRAAESAWFEWSGGSRLVFWRWNSFSKEARDGFPIFTLVPSLRYLSREEFKTIPPRNKALKSLYIDKFVRIIKTGYIEKGPVARDIRCFGVPKGEADIRLVYDGTSSGINQLA